ncbi:MAG: N-acetylmuramoyl-L-alanine amidase [Eubacterium sp.]|nr:N-acetylmuramoyl-L-alanine amidase [Eubacterium sp.]
MERRKNSDSGYRRNAPVRRSDIDPEVYRKIMERRQAIDPEVRRIIMEKRKKARRKKVIIRCTILALILVLIITGIVFLIKALASGGERENTSSKTVWKPDKTAQTEEQTFVEERGIVFIDAGHGGEDPGAEEEGRYEKDDNLLIALAVKKELAKLGLKAVMSREEDVSVDREARGKMANEAGAMLMLSIHRNQASVGEGYEIWVPADGDPASRTLAENILKELDHTGISLNRGVKTGTLTDPTKDYPENEVPNMPSCLLEFGFITSVQDNVDLALHRKQYAEAIARAMSVTYGQLYVGE